MDNNWWKQQALGKLLLVGLFLIGCAGWVGQDMFVLKSNLIQIKGKLRNADVYVSTVTNTYERRGITSSSKSQKAELIFWITGQDHRYILTENIGDNFNDENYNQIQHGLENADSITIWLKVSDTSDFNPKVFQIYGDSKPLLELDTVRYKNLTISAFIFFLGSGLLILYLWGKYPEKFKSVITINKGK